MEIIQQVVYEEADNRENEEPGFEGSDNVDNEDMEELNNMEIASGDDVSPSDLFEYLA